MANKPNILQRLIVWALGDIVDKAIAATVSVRVDDSPGWTDLNAGPNDRPWAEQLVDIKDALDAWRKSFLIRRIVTVTHAYVIGGGITITSNIPEIEKFVRSFWDHPKNKMNKRLIPMCDELTRTGELFPVLFTNHVNGDSYVRFVPAVLIRHVETNPDDLEDELWYQQAYTTHSTEPKIWKGIGDKTVFKPTGGKLPPLMLHHAVNRPIGATRGESDLTVVLPWAKRYSEFLKDRVRINRRRTRQALLDVEIKDGTKVEEKKQQLRTSNPLEHGAYVHGPGEKLELHSLNIQGQQSREDAKNLRLAVSTGAILAPHHMGDGERINRAVAREMSIPTNRFHINRQDAMVGFLINLIEVAYLRKVALGKAKLPEDKNLHLKASVTEISKSDNEALAQAAKDIVEALAEMRDRGWIDDETAIAWAFKFAGEAITQTEIDHIIKTTEQTSQEKESS